MSEGILKNNVEPDVEAMKAAARTLGIKLPRGRAKAETIVKALREGFAVRLKGMPESDWIQCPKCGEVTDDADELESCPFCGDEGVGDNDEDTDEESVEASEIDDGGPDAEEPPTADLDEEPPTAALVDDKPAEEGSPTDALSKRGQRLAERKDTIEKGQRGAVTCLYDVGLALREIHDEELWKEEGHKHFRAFCASITMSHSSAYDLISLVKQFNREKFLEIGPTKLLVVSKADGKERKELEDAAKAGASVGDLKRQRKRKGKEKGKGKAPAGPLEGAKRGRPSKEDQTITLLAKVGGKTTTFPFHDRKNRKEVKVWEAKAECFVEIPISDEVTQFLALKTNKDGGIVGVNVAYRRAEAQADAAE